MNYRTLSTLLVFSLLILASCSSNQRSYEPAVEMDGDSTDAASAQDLKLNTKTPEDRKFIRTADVRFKVKNVISATEQIEDMATSYGGFITYSDL